MGLVFEQDHGRQHHKHQPHTPTGKCKRAEMARLRG
jgi:hypothetical protein